MHLTYHLYCAHHCYVLKKKIWTMEFLFKRASTLCLHYTAYSIFGKRRNNRYHWIHTKYGVPAKTQVFPCILMKEAHLLGVLEKQHSCSEKVLTGSHFGQTQSRVMLAWWQRHDCRSLSEQNGSVQ